MAISKAELKKLRSLKTKKGRTEQKRFWVGGVRVLEEAHKFKFMPVRLFFCQAHLSERAGRLIELYKVKKIVCSMVTSRELQFLTDTETSQGVIGVFDTPEMNLSKLYKPSYRRVLLCDMISDPGNLGTLVRSALAFEFDLIIATDKSVELYSPKVVRSSAGAMFGIPAARASGLELIDFKSSTKARVLAAVSNGKNANFEMAIENEFRKNNAPVILAIGSEADGLSDDVLAMADSKLSVQHCNKVESLNAAVAGSVLMQMIYRITKKEFE